MGGGNKLNIDRIVGPHQYGYGKRFGPQKCGNIIQQALLDGKVVIKSDCSNAFGSINRCKLAKMMFDSPNTKPLWRYLIQRYLKDTSFSVFDAVGNFVDILESSRGINQGDSAALLMFDFFVSDIRIERAIRTLQIHDDIYIICEREHLLNCIEQLVKYAHKKQLKLNVDKTKIITSLPIDTLPASIRHLVTTTPMKIGGVFVHPTLLPLHEQLISSETNYAAFMQLPHQHAMNVLQKALIPKWRYCLDASHPAIIAPLLDRVDLIQKQFLELVLKTTNSHRIPIIEEQLYESTSCGGLGFYKRREMRDHILEGTDSKSLKGLFGANSDWYSGLRPSIATHITNDMPVLTIAPHERFLHIENEAYSAQLALLLGTWTPHDFYCELNGNLTFEQNRDGAQAYTQHAFGCRSCVGGLWTTRHDHVHKGIASTMRHYHVTYSSEPKAWPYRTKSSNSGHDGPDGLLYIGSRLTWTDLAVVNQNYRESSSNLSVTHNAKLTQYSTALNNGVNVVPMVVSMHGALHPRFKQLLAQLAAISGKQLARDIRNIMGVRISEVTILFLNHIGLKKLIPGN